ncbi:MAG: hypothetical protein AT710_07610 [Thermocladium sp. ECH_B]|nr:MAG: hypothetical protein AT710_07610 [Thermocladium sp. ECH_B]
MRLDNGVEISIDKVESRVVAIAVGVGIGSIYEEPNQRGISHLLEHMMFKSNKWIKGEELDMMIEGLGGMANAFTGRDYTIYVFEATARECTPIDRYSMQDDGERYVSIGRIHK